MLCRRSTNYNSISRGTNVLAIPNSGQKLSPDALRSASTPAIVIKPLFVCWLLVFFFVGMLLICQWF